MPPIVREIHVGALMCIATLFWDAVLLLAMRMLSKTLSPSHPALGPLALGFASDH
jgi:hypothetical protein